jgi:hypothetical protein
VTGAEGVAFNFVNGIDVDQATGDVYFTDSSLTYPRRYEVATNFTFGNFAASKPHAIRKFSQLNSLVCSSIYCNKTHTVLVQHNLSTV